MPICTMLRSFSMFGDGNRGIVGVLSLEKLCYIWNLGEKSIKSMRIYSLDLCFLK